MRNLPTEIRGRVALVTGASRGLGALICRTLAEQGAQVVGVARSSRGLTETQATVEAIGGTFTALPFDLSRPQLLGDLQTEVESRVGQIDILVNNAGVERYVPFQEGTFDQLQEILQTNLVAPMELTRRFLPGLLERGGHIVNIASLGGKKGIPFNSVYSASKGGIVLWSDGLRQELRGTRVKVSVICPGYVSEAGMFADARQDISGLLGTVPAQKVADAVLHALRCGTAEIVLNSGPIKLLLALNQFVPEVGDRITHAFGLTDYCRKRIS
jgi:short-subunit dehydrogenase